MISIYAETFLDKERIPNAQCSQFTDLNQANAELQGYMISACELGLMGYWSNGTEVKPDFSPNQTLTRAEAGVILSRMLRGNTYAGDENKRYQDHLQALQSENIMHYISTPMMKELRGNVLLMLRRLSQ